MGGWVSTSARQSPTHLLVAASFSGEKLWGLSMEDVFLCFGSVERMASTVANFSSATPSSRRIPFLSDGSPGMGLMGNVLVLCTIRWQRGGGNSFAFSNSRFCHDRLTDQSVLSPVREKRASASASKAS